MRRWGVGREDSRVSVLGESDRVSEGSLWGEQLDWGAATLPTLSSLSRINDGVRPIRIHERAGRPSARTWPRTHAHTPTASHTLSVSDLHRHDRPPPCHIYPQQCRGEGRLLLVSNKRPTLEWGEAKRSPIFPLQRPPTLPSPWPPCLTSNEVDKC